MIHHHMTIPRNFPAVYATFENYLLFFHEGIFFPKVVLCHELLIVMGSSCRDRVPTAACHSTITINKKDQILWVFIWLNMNWVSETPSSWRKIGLLGAWSSHYKVCLINCSSKLPLFLCWCWRRSQQATSSAVVRWPESCSAESSQMRWNLLSLSKAQAIYEGQQSLINFSITQI